MSSKLDQHDINQKEIKSEYQSKIGMLKSKLQDIKTKKTWESIWEKENYGEISDLPFLKPLNVPDFIFLKVRQTYWANIHSAYLRGPEKDYETFEIEVINDHSQS